MIEQFDLKPTNEELAFARMRHLRDIEFLRQQPLNPFTFSEYWNLRESVGRLTMRGGDNPATDIVNGIVDRYKQLAVLMNNDNKNLKAWNNAVRINREWVTSLNDKEKKELHSFDNYGHWNPSLLINDPMTINGHLRMFPNIADGDAIPGIVWKYENPKSPDKLPGAVSTPRHDAIHCVLGRGGLQADEAFILGFTMGGASGQLTSEHIRTFINAFTKEYPKPYKIDEKFVVSYIAGVETGRTYFKDKNLDLSNTNFSNVRNIPLGQLREQLGINIDDLSAIYTFEREMTESKATSRSRAMPKVSELGLRPFG